MNGYIVFYNGQSSELYANDLYSAKKLAIQLLKVPKKKEHMVSVCLAEIADEQVETVLS